MVLELDVGLRIRTSQGKGIVTGPCWSLPARSARARQFNESSRFPLWNVESFCCRFVECCVQGRHIGSPPETSTLPLSSNVAVWPERPGLRLSVAIQFPLAGSYSSAVATRWPFR